MMKRLILALFAVLAVCQLQAQTYERMADLPQGIYLVTWNEGRNRRSTKFVKK